MVFSRAFSAVYCVRLSHAITCPFSKYLQMLYIFAQILKYFALFCSFQTFPFWPFICPFSKKRMPLLCRIGPDYYCQGGRKLSPTSFLLSSNYRMLSASSSTDIFIQINQYNSMRRSFQWTFAVYRIGAKSELVLTFQNIFK